MEEGCFQKLLGCAPRPGRKILGSCPFVFPQLQGPGEGLGEDAWACLVLEGTGNGTAFTGKGCGVLFKGVATLLQTKFLMQGPSLKVTSLKMKLAVGLRAGRCSGPTPPPGRL